MQLILWLYLFRSKECSLYLDEFIALFGLDVDESKVKWDISVLHQHTFHFAWIIILAHLNKVG